MIRARERMIDLKLDSTSNAASPAKREASPMHRRRGPLPALLSWLGLPLAAVYARVIAGRNQGFDRRVGVIELDRPVISVGNLSVGGTGKTPMVGHVLAVLNAAGHTPCVAMRGYGGRSGGQSGARSDEADEHRRAFPEVPIVAQPNRVEGLIGLFGSDAGDDIDVVVLDDGFQHRRIWRELDIVLVDATASPFEDRLLPAGWLREPVESLRRASATVITRAERVSPGQLADLENKLKRACERPVTAVCRHAWRSLTVYERGGGVRTEPVPWLSSQRVGAACAIGNPDAFLAQVRDAARTVVGAVVLPDHDAYGQAALSRVADLVRVHGAGAIVVTSKDWSKLSHVPGLLELAPIVVPELRLVFERGEEYLREMILRAAAFSKVRAQDDEAFDEAANG